MTIRAFHHWDLRWLRRSRGAALQGRTVQKQAQTEWETEKPSRTINHRGNSTDGFRRPEEAIGFHVQVASLSMVCEIVICLNSPNDSRWFFAFSLYNRPSGNFLENEDLMLS